MTAGQQSAATRMSHAARAATMPHEDPVCAIGARRKREAQPPPHPCGAQRWRQRGHQGELWVWRGWTQFILLLR